MTAHAFAVAMAALGVNGPDDVVQEWDAINWRLHEDNVRRLRQRIFTAVKDGDWPKVRDLQKLMLRSWSNTLVTVRQASQRNTGRKTAEIDGEVASTPAARRAGSATRSNPNGQPSSNPDRMGFDRVAAPTTRSVRSSPSVKAVKPRGCGR